VRHCDRPIPAETQRWVDRADVGRHQVNTVVSFLHLHDPTLTLGLNTVTAADARCPLYTGPRTQKARNGSFQLRQLFRVRRSFDRESAAAVLTHAFVTSRIDYGNAQIANAPKTSLYDWQAAAGPECRRPSHHCVASSQLPDITSTVFFFTCRWLTGLIHIQDVTSRYSDGCTWRTSSGTVEDLGWRLGRTDRRSFCQWWYRSNRWQIR